MVVLDHFNSSVFSVLHRVFFIRNDYEKRGGKNTLGATRVFFSSFLCVSKCRTSGVCLGREQNDGWIVDDTKPLSFFTKRLRIYLTNLGNQTKCFVKEVKRMFPRLPSILPTEMFIFRNNSPISAPSPRSPWLLSCFPSNFNREENFLIPL